MKRIKDYIRKVFGGASNAPLHAPAVTSCAKKDDLTFCCPAVSSFFFAFPFHHIDDEQIAAFCCELSLKFPSVPLEKTGKETIRNFLQMRSRFIAEGSSVLPPLYLKIVFIVRNFSCPVGNTKNKYP